MTEDAALRERIARMEVQIAHLVKQGDEQAAILRRLDETFQQAKGARYVIVGSAAIAGFVAAKAPTIALWLGIVR